MDAVNYTSYLNLSNHMRFMVILPTQATLRIYGMRVWTALSGKVVKGLGLEAGLWKAPDAAMDGGDIVGDAVGGGLHADDGVGRVDEVMAPVV
ncbi:hypothetical protein VNO78_15242 [Psophocarpus tetragonolobus]|uniref:Uncharacterized protein n=1 Tax=Psophocarpus tetragonolobus TaxID=3891 RepID=A0AAN9XJ17_PSOTE